MPRFGVVNQVTGAVATAPVLLAPASPDRVYLAISIDAGTGYVQTSLNAAAGVGYPITNAGPLLMSYEEYGELIRVAWYGSADTGARKFGVIDLSE